MSWERLAKLLDVDEVQVHHGEKGYLFLVRKSNSTLAVTIDHSDMAHDTHHKKWSVLMADKLNVLSDKLHKALGVTRVHHDKVHEAEQSVMERYPAMRDVWGDVREAAYQPVLRDTYRPPERVQLPPPQETQWASTSEPAPPQEPQGPTVSAPMGSRFEAIVRELEKM